MGKGSGRRPCEVAAKQFESNWDEIFGKKTENKIDKIACKKGKMPIAHLMC